MKYIKNPVTVDAIKWDGSEKSTREVYAFIGQPIGPLKSSTDQNQFTDFVDLLNLHGFAINTKEGVMIANVGDYIIKEPFPTGDRDYYPCKAEIFEKTYSMVMTSIVLT